ncbi:hypothetical protein C1645_841484 [Glomus cerebriforme]|uniref:Uncharacterized protein n=1 Tax=Glomus cerebriforme TaxID=658196 RepID=A0A397S2S9_9GLOM|nr:hypothetical protein C1645_841484 [Glomus cerebriforme]
MDLNNELISNNGLYLNTNDTKKSSLNLQNRKSQSGEMDPINSSSISIQTNGINNTIIEVKPYNQMKNPNIHTSNSSNPFAFTPQRLSHLADLTQKNKKSSITKEWNKQDNVQPNLNPIVESSPFYQRIKFYAAIVSLGFGLYKDFGTKITNRLKIRWVEGVSILFIILVIVLVDSFNDWLKERQFQKDVETHSLDNINIGNPISLQQVNSTLPQDILQLLNELIAINSTSFEDETESGKRTFISSKTETALLEFLLDITLIILNIKR